MSYPQRALADLGALVLRAREAKGWGRRAASKTGLGPSSPTTWESVEKGERVQTLTYAGIEKALDWPVGSILAYLDGGPAPDTLIAEPDPSGLPPRVHEATYDELYEAIARVGDRLPPRIDSATHEQLLDELRRRHEADRAELARRLYPVLAEEETADSVRARGRILGRRVVDEGTGNEAKTDDAARGTGAT